MKVRLSMFAGLGVLLLVVTDHDSDAQNKQPPKAAIIPHGQSVPPGPAISPEEAIKKMQVPPGFHVELVASEPGIVNPVAMTFDEKGRIWITESIEYPRKSAGPGKDRVKLLESTKGDGKFDKIRTVIEGLNIPSGIAVGHGGVWLVNSPDILYYPFEDFAAGKLAKPEVVVTGFGRSDTHELPNSLTWGPDGWLYGLNGVFNFSHVKYRGKEHKFTCALFRIHPKTKEFELFCEGTSNPWGLAFNENGDAFVSACVIDHLWHLTETGYYHRQGGPYPPFSWKIDSIVKHRHQKAAYCGLCWFDSDAYPPEYRGKLYMGNIHGNCVNADELSRDGSTYFGKPRPDFLSANDAWFMPVAQKIGPDGCMYILDWYDRYHCYQDANRDPAGIDRLQGRLYRVVYKDHKPAGTIDLQNESDDQLIERLHSPNLFYRELAQRILTERLAPNEKATGKLKGELTEKRFKLVQLIRDEKALPTAKMHALWTILSTASFNDVYTLDYLLHSKDERYRAWAVRAMGAVDSLQTRAAIAAGLARDPSPDVQLQVAIAARKLKPVDPLPVLLEVLTHCGDDKLIPHIVWQNLHPLLEKDGERFLTLAAKVDLAKAPGFARVLPRAIDRMVGSTSGDPTAVAGLVDKLVATNTNEADATAKLCLTGLAIKIQNKEVGDKALNALRDRLKPTLLTAMSSPRSSMAVEASILLAVMKDPEGIMAAHKQFASGGYPDGTRIRLMNALIASGDGPGLLSATEEMLRDRKGSPEFRGQVLASLGALDDPRVASQVLEAYSKMEPELQPKAIELLTQRPAWGKALFKEIAAKKISKDAINVNQARRLLSAKDVDLARLVEKNWGVPRENRNPEREQVAAQMKELFKKTSGDPAAGVLVFKKLCAQCHKIHGEGVDVGPDITSNGRNDFDQLLSNIFDPSLVIGAGYQAVTVNTKQGQVVSGLVVEDGPQRIVLKVQGGEIKTIARQDVDEQFTSKVSLMPEDLEKQLRPQEIVDLLTYLSLDRPPGDPKARKIPGTPR